MLAFPSPVERRSIISEVRDLAWPGMKYTLQDLQINNTHFDLPFQLNLQTSCTYQCQALGTQVGERWSSMQGSNPHALHLPLPFAAPRIFTWDLTLMGTL